MTEGPALVVGRRTCVPAADRLAHALHTGFDALPQRQRSMARFIFLDARLYSGKHPHDPRLAELVGELSGRDEDLPTWWDGHGIKRHRRSGPDPRRPHRGARDRLRPGPAPARPVGRTGRPAARPAQSSDFHT
ncbi:hypothetical protein PV341_12695 [Streptomyces sp. PA03-1a]|nr:hypothetical protein [Streptomyces sp. PA03-1a]MDX2814125.1 hypothetical protein [Streptomyces sp. PA03-5A]